MTTIGSPQMGIGVRGKLAQKWSQHGPKMSPGLSLTDPQYIPKGPPKDPQRFQKSDPCKNGSTPKTRRCPCSSASRCFWQQVERARNTVLWRRAVAQGSCAPSSDLSDAVGHTHASTRVCKRLSQQGSVSHAVEHMIRQRRSEYQQRPSARGPHIGTLI